MKTKGITIDTIISQAEEIVASDIDGETVMMSVENGKYYGLDEIGSHIWELIERPIKVSNFIDTLFEKFDVTSERDVLIFINELNEDRILQARE